MEVTKKLSLYLSKCHDNHDCKMDIDYQELKEILQEILDYFQEDGAEGEESKYLNENFFLTPHGKEFFEGVKDTYEFVSRGIIITAILDFYPIITKVFDVFSREDIFDESKIKNDEKELLEIMKKITTNPEVMTQLDDVPFFESGDIPRFVSALVFSVYTYCEVFINKLTDRTFENSEFAWKYLKYRENLKKVPGIMVTTSDMEDFKTDSDIYASKAGKKIFDQNERGNPYSRQLTLMRVLGIEGVLIRLFHDLDEPDYIKNFEGLLNCLIIHVLI